MTKKYEEKISSKIDKEMIWVWNNLRDSNFPTQENYYISVFGKVYFFAIFILLSILILSSNWIFFIYFTNDYNYYLNGSEAFKLSLDWKIHGFSLRKIELLREVGFDDSYFIGDEIATRIFYFKSKKITFCDTNFYYRIDNANALTKMLRPNLVDFITGDLILLNFIKNNYNKESLFLEYYDKTFKKTYKLLRNIKKRFNTLNQHEKEEFLHRLIQVEEEIFDIYINNQRRGKISWFKIKFYISKLKKCY